MDKRFNRRQLLVGAGQGLAAATMAGCAASKPRGSTPADVSIVPQPGCQRLSLRQLQEWESLGFGMFIHFGMSTFLRIDDPT